MLKLLRSKFKKNIRSLFNFAGYNIIRCQKNGMPTDFDDSIIDIIQKVQPYTMTSYERINSLVASTKYIVQNNIKGAIVEYGVWRGGSMMAVCYELLKLGDLNREIYLYDVFDSLIPPPSDCDLS